MITLELMGASMGAISGKNHPKRGKKGLKLLRPETAKDVNSST